MPTTETKEKSSGLSFFNAFSIRQDLKLRESRLREIEKLVNLKRREVDEKEKGLNEKEDILKEKALLLQKKEEKLDEEEHTLGLKQRALDDKEKEIRKDNNQLAKEQLTWLNRKQHLEHAIISLKDERKNLAKTIADEQQALQQKWGKERKEQQQKLDATLTDLRKRETLAEQHFQEKSASLKQIQSQVALNKKNEEKTKLELEGLEAKKAQIYEKERLLLDKEEQLDQRKQQINEQQLELQRQQDIIEKSKTLWESKKEEAKDTVKSIDTKNKTTEQVLREALKRLSK